MTREKSGPLLLMAALAVLTVLAGGAHATTICDVQRYDAMGLSPFLGETVTVRGVVTIPPGYFQSNYTSFYIEDDGCGVNVFTFGSLTVEPALGDTVLVTGEVEEYISASSGGGATTEVVLDPNNPDESIEFLSIGNTPPEPTVMGLARLGVESNEGRLVRTIGKIVNVEYVSVIGQWSMDIVEPWSEESFEVFQSFNDSISFEGLEVGDTVDVTGFVTQFDRTPPRLSDYQFAPRFQHEIRRAIPPDPPDPLFWGNASLDIPASTFRPDLGEILPIHYMAPDLGRAMIEIYDLQGRRVRTLTDATYEGTSAVPGHYQEGYFDEGVRGWDGRDDLRRLVPAGVYICRLEVADGDGRVTSATAPAVVAVRLD